jgi:Zn-dependent protease
VLAFLLNILPVPGLDGFGVLEPYLPAQARRFADTVGLYAILALVLLIIAVPAVGMHCSVPASRSSPRSAATCWQPAMASRNSCSGADE